MTQPKDHGSNPRESQNNWLLQAATSNLEFELIKRSSLK